MSSLPAVVLYATLLLLVVTVLKLLVSLSRAVYHCFLGPLLGINVDFKKYAGK